MILTLQRTILFPQSPSVLKYSPRYLGLIMYLVLKLYSSCSTVTAHAQQIYESRGSHADVIYENLLSSVQVWQSYRVVVHVEPEMPNEMKMKEFKKELIETENIY